MLCHENKFHIFWVIKTREGIMMELKDNLCTTFLYVPFEITLA